MERGAHFLILYYPVPNTVWTAYTGYLKYTARFPVVRTHARTYRYTVVHHYRYTRVHHFRYEHVDESTPIAPR